MVMKNILLFLIVCGLAGVCILIGSVLGHSQGKTALFSGAIVGGLVGVAVAVWLSTRLRLLDRSVSRASFLGAVAGFIVAAVIAVNNLHGPLIPMASVGLIGLGALVGKMFGQRRAE